MVIDNGRQDHIERDGEVAPEEQAVRDVEWLAAVLVGPEHRMF